MGNMSFTHFFCFTLKLSGDRSVEQHFAFDCWTLQMFNLETVLIPFRLKNSQYFPLKSESGFGVVSLNESLQRNPNP